MLIMFFYGVFQRYYLRYIEKKYMEKLEIKDIATPICNTDFHAAGHGLNMVVNSLNRIFRPSMIY